MKFYALLSGNGWPRTYVGKIFLISFIGVHVPIFGAVIYAVLASGLPLESLYGLLAAMLAATFVGTAATLWALFTLTAPVRRAAAAIDDYLEDRTFPTLPTRYTDEVGVLMRNLQEGVTRLDAALDASASRLDEAERVHAEKFEMLFALRHELCTPLNHVIGFAEMMSNEMLGPIGQEMYKGYAEDIGSSGEMLRKLTQSVLELSEVEAGRVDRDAQAVALRPAVEQTIAQQHLHAEAKEIRIAFESGDVDTVFATPRALKQSLLCLFEVGLDIMPTGSTLHAFTRMHGAFGVIGVTTDGVFALDDLPPELRLENSGFLPYGGALSLETASSRALRLSLLNSLVRMQGGGIAVERLGGDRMRIEIRLPLARTVTAPTIRNAA